MKRYLVVGVSLPCAGTERALLGFLKTLDPEENDVLLLLARREGALLPLVPPAVRVLTPMKFGEAFFLSSSNAARFLTGFVLAHPGAAFGVLRSFLIQLLRPKRRSACAARLWVDLMKRYCPPFEEEYGISAPFDAVFSFFGDRTTFYAAEKVKADRHYAWLHFDYLHPAREDALYLPYFRRCEAVYSVSEECTALLRAHFAGEGVRFETKENGIDRETVLRLSREPLPFAPPPGKRILFTPARICRQKGIDRVPEILALLSARFPDLYWIVAGEAGDLPVGELTAEAARRGVGDLLFFAGALVNPYPLFAACDVFVLPSRYEGRSLAIGEALLFPAPLVVSETLSTASQLAGVPRARLTAQSVPALAEGIAEILEKPV